MTSTFLDVAVSIGQTICQTAYWDLGGHRCNWIGRQSQVGATSRRTVGPSAGALPPTLYSGTSGVGLFLAELFGRTREPLFRRTALGAANQALQRCETALLDGHRWPLLSFFEGQVGVAYAACRIAKLVEAEGLIDSARGLVDRAWEERRRPHTLDVMGGNAGAIPALLSLERDYGLTACSELAVWLAEELCEHSINHDSFATWDPIRTGGADVASAALTGLAHGASGIGLALLEAYAATGNSKFRDAGRLALAYEDSVFDAKFGNWPDFRKPLLHARTDRGPEFAVAWCHGAAGIALCRLRAMELDPARHDQYAIAAQTGLRTTLDAAGRLSEVPRFDSSLCHGLSGLGEIIMAAGIVLGDEEYVAGAKANALQLIVKYARKGDWPTGVGGPTPCLMLGTAGVGYHLLRLDSPREIAPILALNV